jgi:hypothetical protein
VTQDFHAEAESAMAPLFSTQTDSRFLSVCRDCTSSVGMDVRRLRGDATVSFERAGIDLSYLDTAVVSCLIAISCRAITNPVGYCIAVGRRLQDESVAAADRRRREFEERFRETCPHGSNLEVCPECSMDRQRALDIFPALRRHVPESTVGTPIKEGGTR